MKQITRIFALVIIQYLVTFLSLGLFESDYPLVEGTATLWMLGVPGIIAASLIMMKGLLWLDKHIINELIEIEMTKREKEYENSKTSIQHHEVNRDIQLIKVLYEEGKKQEIKDYIS